MKPRPLTPPEFNRKHPATLFWLVLALLRLGIRQGPKQLELILQKSDTWKETRQ